MKILIPGNKVRLLKYKEFHCKDCGCVFIADQTEYKDFSSQNEGPIFVRACPCCAMNVFNNTWEFLVVSDVLTSNVLTANGFVKQINK